MDTHTLDRTTLVEDSAVSLPLRTRPASHVIGGSSWTDERVVLLKKLWADGLSGNQIAVELGGITRNAVIGKVHRLGLTGRKTSTSSTGRPRIHRAAGSMRRVPPQAMVAAEPEPEVIEAEIPISQRLTLMNLTTETCHWPIGDPGSPDFFFCGGRALKKHPYCAHHSRVAHQPHVDRRPVYHFNTFGMPGVAR